MIEIIIQMIVDFRVIHMSECSDKLSHQYQPSLAQQKISSSRFLCRTVIYSITNHKLVSSSIVVFFVLFLSSSSFSYVFFSPPPNIIK